eukprot:366281-Chlamydomonas_euryale.AAC.13
MFAVPLRMGAALALVPTMQRVAVRAAVGLLTECTRVQYYAQNKRPVAPLPKLHLSHVLRASHSASALSHCAPNPKWHGDTCHVAGWKRVVECVARCNQARVQARLHMVAVVGQRPGWRGGVGVRGLRTELSGMPFQAAPSPLLDPLCLAALNTGVPFVGPLPVTLTLLSWRMARHMQQCPLNAACKGRAAARQCLCFDVHAAACSRAPPAPSCCAPAPLSLPCPARHRYATSSPAATATTAAAALRSRFITASPSPISATPSTSTASAPRASASRSAEKSVRATTAGDAAGPRKHSCSSTAGAPVPEAEVLQGSSLVDQLPGCTGAAEPLPSPSLPTSHPVVRSHATVRAPAAAIARSSRCAASCTPPPPPSRSTTRASGQ